MFFVFKIYPMMDSEFARLPTQFIITDLNKFSNKLLIMLYAWFLTLCLDTKGCSEMEKFLRKRGSRDKFGSSYTRRLERTTFAKEL